MSDFTSNDPRAGFLIKSAFDKDVHNEHGFTAVTGQSLTIRTYRRVENNMLEEHPCFDYNNIKSGRLLQKQK